MKIYVDANRPERSITRNQAFIIIRKLAAGFHAEGIRQGDCVCVHAFNDVGHENPRKHLYRL